MFSKIQKDSESLRSKYGRESFKVMGSSRYVLRLWVASDMSKNHDLSMRCGTVRGRYAPSMAANRGKIDLNCNKQGSLRSKYGRESKELAHKKVDTNLTKKTILHINNTLLDIGLKHPSISNHIRVIALENAKIPRAIIFLAIY